MRDEKLLMFSRVHLHYEIDMCTRSVVLLATGATNGFLTNLLIESYAVHVRALIDFIYGPSKKRYDDDLSAASFVKAHEPWIGARGPEAPKPLKIARRRADKQVVHFTKKRYAHGTPETRWRVELEIPALVGGLQLFLRYADPQKLDPVISDAVTKLASIAVALERAGGS